MYIKVNEQLLEVSAPSVVVVDPEAVQVGLCLIEYQLKQRKELL